MKTLVAVLGRMCLSAIFILAGASSIWNWQGSETFLLNSFCDLLNYTRESQNLQGFLTGLIPWTNELLGLAVVFEILGGILLFFGLKLRFASFLLLLFLIPTTIVCHHFWYLEGPEREVQTIMFFKNLSILGGLMIVLAFGKGGASSREEKEEK